MLFTKTNTTTDVFSSIIKEADKLGEERNSVVLRATSGLFGVEVDRASYRSRRVAAAVAKVAEAEEAAAKEADPEKAEAMLVEAAGDFQEALPSDAYHYLEVCPLLVEHDQEGEIFFRVTPLGRWLLEGNNVLEDAEDIASQVLHGTFEPEASRASAAEVLLREAKEKAKEANFEAWIWEQKVAKEKEAKVTGA